MLGGGQLGRMFTVAARTMGYRVMVLDPDPESPAGRLANEHLCAGYDDAAALARLGDACAAVTTEFENVPAQSLLTLEKRIPVRPSARALSTAQDRIREKTFIREIGLATAPFAAIERADDLEQACYELTSPLILKRSALGYDGKGQIAVDDLPSARVAFERLEKTPCVLEEKRALKTEISVILARGITGEMVFYPLAENMHENGILSTSTVPARIDAAVSGRARGMARRLAETLDYCGVMAVEFFITRDGELLVNEIAPRPHNSGHYTLDACVTSQFKQQVRMICELPPGDTRLLSPVVMINLLGDLWKQGPPDWSPLLAHPKAKLHLYGKREARPGRKMGHFCVLDEDLAVAERAARDILARLSH